MKSVTFGPEDGVYTGIVGMDPAAEWLLGPGVQDYLPDGEDTLIPFTMRIHDPKAIELFNRFLNDGELGWYVLVPGFYHDPGKERTIGIDEYFTAFARKAYFDDLASENGDFGQFREAQKEIRLGTPIGKSALSNWEPGQPIPQLLDPPVGPPPGGWPQDTVVIGIIDDGIAFAHERFRTTSHAAGMPSHSARVQCFWRQDGPEHTDQLPTTVNYGREICKQDDSVGRPGIDSLLAATTVADVVDEDELYRRAALIDFALPGHKAAAWRASHGTHVLDLAAGEDPTKNVTNRPVVAVQLPIDATQDSSLSKLYEPLCDAVRYILDRAGAMAGGGAPLPVVINFSYGNIADRHDGTTRVEVELDNQIATQAGRLSFVLPAGNSHLSRCHAAVAFAQTGDVAALRWRVQPDDLTPSFVEIWLPYGGASPPSPDRVKLSIVTPSGLETAQTGETHNTGVHVLSDGGQIICEARYRFEAGDTRRGMFLVKLQPTARLQPAAASDADRIAPSGVWTIKLHNVSLGPNQPVHAWIQRDDTPYGYPRGGRQSYFDEPCYVRFDVQGLEIEEDSHAEQVASPCHVKRAGLINAIATGERPVVIGGFLRKDLRPAKYSAGGPITPKQGGTLNPNFRKPDAMSVSDDSKVHAGVIAAGSRSGSFVALSGTSVAAPQITRGIADQLANGNPGDRNAVKALAQAHEAGYPATKPPLPPDRGGWGRITPPPGASIRRYVK